jgi:hypothetical protein
VLSSSRRLQQVLGSPLGSIGRNVELSTCQGYHRSCLAFLLLEICDTTAESKRMLVSTETVFDSGTCSSERHIGSC